MLTVRGLSPLTLAHLAVVSERRSERPVHALICIADHFEPLRGPVRPSVARQRVGRWLREYPSLARQFSDSRGRLPQHTFFYPAEDYEPEYLDSLARLCHQGLGEVEVHLHHDRDTPERLTETLLTFTSALYNRHGLLHKDAAGQIRYGFIHGNWALDNSRPDGRWCGVNNELDVLLSTGCYGDFTMPSAPAPCQTSTINNIYYAQDDPAQPKSHDCGTRAAAGSHAPANSLLMIQGPLALDWRRRKFGLLPGIENGELTGVHPPTLHRLALWLRANVHVAGRADWCFIKLHTHGAWEANTAMLLGEPMRAFHAALGDFAGRNDWFRYYYVTAREMAGLVHAVESGGRHEPPALALEALSRPTSAELLPATA